VSPEPEISQVASGVPGKQFSASIGFPGDEQLDQTFVLKNNINAPSHKADVMADLHIEKAPCEQKINQK